MTNNNKSSKLRSIIKYTTSIATISFVLFKVYDTYCNQDGSDKHAYEEDSAGDAETLEIEQFDELIKTINKPFLDDLKHYKRLIKKTTEDDLKMKYWETLSEKTIVLLVNYLITTKIIKLVIKDQSASTANKKIIIYTYLKVIVKNQFKILNNCMKLNDEEEAGLVIMKVMSFREFNNLIKQNVLDNNLDNVSLFLNFGNNIVKASILELQPENTVNENDLERQIRSVQNDIVKILFDNNTDEDYASISDYLDNFNSTSDSPNIEPQPAADEIPEGQFAMFITLLIKQLDNKLSF